MCHSCATHVPIMCHCLPEQPFFAVKQLHGASPPHPNIGVMYEHRCQSAPVRQCLVVIVIFACLSLLLPVSQPDAYALQQPPRASNLVSSLSISNSRLSPSWPVSLGTMKVEVELRKPTETLWRFWWMAQVSVGGARLCLFWTHRCRHTCSICSCHHLRGPAVRQLHRWRAPRRAALGPALTARRSTVPRTPCHICLTTPTSIWPP